MRRGLFLSKTKGGLDIKRLSVKGFTLVEIIVVLVIIAILVATTLPALTGYIQDAGDKTAIAETRTYLVAAQSISSELYGLGCSEKNITRWLLDGTRTTETGMVPTSYTTTVASLTGVAHFKNYGNIKHFIVNSSATVQIMELYTSNGRSVVYEDGAMHIGTVK